MAFIMLGNEESFDDFDHLSSQTNRAGYKTVDLHLSRFINFLKTDPVFHPFCFRLQDSVDFPTWYAEAKKSIKGMAGSGNLNWPIEDEKRLGLWIELLNSFVEGDESIVDFSHCFSTAGSNYDDMVYDFLENYFDPFSEDLKRLVRKKIEIIETIKIGKIPAADRFVTLDHNSKNFKEAIQALEKTIKAVKGSNEYAKSDQVDQEQRAAELEAGKTLLKSKRVSVRNVLILLSPVLTYLALKFMDAFIGDLASKALELITGLF